MDPITQIYNINTNYIIYTYQHKYNNKIII